MITKHRVLNYGHSEQQSDRGFMSRGKILYFYLLVK